MTNSEIFDSVCDKLELTTANIREGMASCDDYNRGAVWQAMLAYHNNPNNSQLDDLCSALDEAAELTSTAYRQLRRHVGLDD